ncbi:hypothetical protein BCR35DRAFT_313730 [Leucosporidium creatinivorum]|uniref:Uncharacterized protein n=1 Tax=Leucosporidium creatinivorum TaxID=106004 RepID=A0A1Y2FEJ5_9BASI|nr:hypothetical protein BCR35DRAFT_313730 [Leucosporidium creatinivorum]
MAANLLFKVLSLRFSSSVDSTSMNAPPELHFGRVGIARLSQIKQAINRAELEPVAAHWGNHPLVLYIPPLTFPLKPEGRPRTSAEVEKLRNEYFGAIQQRTEFARLFIGPNPFFEQFTVTVNGIGLGYRPQDAQLCNSIVTQGERQALDLQQNWENVFRSFVQRGALSAGSLNRLPFIKLMLEPSMAALLYRYVEYAVLRMAKSCWSNPSASSPVVWLGYKDWDEITFYDQARVVVAAKEYEEYIHNVAHAQRSGLGASSVEVPWHLQHANFASFGHQHVPSLSSRQARRNGVLQSELARRWE